MTADLATNSSFDGLCQLIDASREELSHVAAQVCVKFFGVEQAVLLLPDYTGHAFFAAGVHCQNQADFSLPIGRFEIASSAVSPLLRATQSTVPLILKHPAEVIEFDTVRLGVPTPGAGMELALCPLRSTGQETLAGLLVLAGRELQASVADNAQSGPFLAALARLLVQVRERRQAKSQISDMAERLDNSSHATAERREERLKQGLFELFPGPAIALRNLRSLLAMRARMTPALLLSGACGSGKEATARAMHEASCFYAGRFVYVDCALFDASLFLAELFGVRRGTVPGRATGRKGYLREASEGTLYLDNLDELPGAAQGPIFRLVERGQYRPIGAETDVRFKGRIIAGTKKSLRDLQAQAGAGHYDPRFLGKLSTNAVQIPEITTCADGFRDLVTSYLNQGVSETTLDATPKVSKDAWAYLETVPWPGQFRQLFDTLRAALLAMEEGAANVIFPHHLIDNPDFPHHLIDNPDFEAAFVSGSGQASKNLNSVNGAGYNLKTALNALEASLIRRALSEGDGNRAFAAQLLNIPKRTLADKCKKHRL